MKRDKSPSFIVELPLRVSDSNERWMLSRLEAGRRLYNTALGEALRRLCRLRESKAWQRARTLKDKEERAATFKKLSVAAGFTSDAVSSYATGCKNAAHWKGRLGAHETQHFAERAFAAVAEYAYGVRGRPRFKGANRPLHSIEGKNNDTGAKWRREIGCVVWGDRVLRAMFTPGGRDPWQVQAVAARTKYCRIVWRMINGRRRWYVQLVQEGISPARYVVAAGAVVGLDVGPSTVAIVGDAGGVLVKFAPGVTQPWRKMRRLQRAMDRSRRATNPQCYNADGTWRRGSRVTVRSQGYRRRQILLADTERRLAAERKRSHGEIGNAVLAQGTVVQTEKLSYVAFQRVYGRSVKVRAPGKFITKLCRKAESAGGALRELNTWTLKMSQYDHPTGTCTKKPLAQRWHLLGGAGTTFVQRDVYSAFLARCVIGQSHQPSHIASMWAAAEPLLGQAGWCVQYQPASGSASVLPPAPVPAERVARQSRLGRSHGPEVVAVRRAPGDPAMQSCL